MTNEDAIKTINIAMAEVEWDYPMDYAVAFEMAIDALEKQMQNCEDCRHADCVQNNHMIYCLEHSCVMSSDNCCRDWSDEDDK